MAGVSVAIDPLLQEELASLILTDRGFANKFHRYITDDEDIKKKKIQVFSNPHIGRIVTLSHELYKKADDTFPTEGIMCSEIERLQLSKEERSVIRSLYLKLKNSKIILTKNHELHLVELIKIAKVSTYLESVMKEIKEPSNQKILKIADMCKSLVAEIEDVTFTTSDIINMESFTSIIEEYADESASNIPMGIPELDQELNGGGEGGGLSRQEVTVFISGTNDGKSLALISISANAMRAGFKVRNFAFEGKKLQTPVRYISNLTGVSSKKIDRFRSFKARNPDGSLPDFLSPEEIKAIEEGEKLFGNKFKIIHAIKNSEIEHVEAIAIEEYKKDPFDVLVIDYGQLVESVKTFHKEHELLMYVFRRLEKLAAQLNVSIQVAMQVNREGLKELSDEAAEGEEFPTYKMSHVAGGYGTLKTAGCVIAISRTKEERNLGQLRYTILKQRGGLVGVEVGIRAGFDEANLTKGPRYRYYHPVESAIGAAPDLFSNTKPTAALEKIESSVKAEVGQSFDLEKAIQGNPFFKQLSGIGGVEQVKEMIGILINLQKDEASLSEVQATLKGANEGRIEIDPEEKQELEKEFQLLRKAREEILSSDVWIMTHGPFISKNLMPFIKRVDSVANSEIFTQLKKSSDYRFEHLKNLMSLIGLIRMLKIVDFEA